MASATGVRDGRVLNALTFDVEDWYQGIEIAPSRWPEFEKRLEIGVNTILKCLHEAKATGTFFVLGQCAEEHPELIRSIAEAGHEIATHGYSHTKIYDMPLTQFAEELSRAVEVTEAATGATITGHRAPYFSITKESYAALGILKEQGFLYDASIFPGKTWRYGIPEAPKSPYVVPEYDLIEFPVSIYETMGKRLGLGGAYFRIFPYGLTSAGIQQRNVEGQPAIFYLHPWEFDPSHPRVEFERKAQLTHYFNLAGTTHRLRRLLREFRFGTVSQVLATLELTKPVVLAHA